jgi:hypothetical protein
MMTHSLILGKLLSMYCVTIFIYFLYFCRAQRLEKAGLSEYAQHVLQQICSQEWVLVRCLQNPEDLCHAEMLLDNMLTPKQAQRLLRMICYPENPAAASDNQEQPQVITRILEVSHQSFLF